MLMPNMQKGKVMSLRSKENIGRRFHACCQVVDQADNHEHESAEEFPGNDADHERFHFLVELIPAIMANKFFDHPAEQKRMVEPSHGMGGCHKEEHRVDWPPVEAKPEEADYSYQYKAASGSPEERFFWINFEKAPDRAEFC